MKVVVRATLVCNGSVDGGSVLSVVLSVALRCCVDCRFPAKGQGQGRILL